MGEFSLSGNATNIGISAVEISLNTSKGISNSKFFTTPSSGSGTESSASSAAADCINSTMQDEQITDKSVVSGASVGAGVSANVNNISVGSDPGVTSIGPDDLSISNPIIVASNTTSDKIITSTNSPPTTAPSKDLNLDSTPGPGALQLTTDKLSDQVPVQVPNPKLTSSSLPPLFHPVDASPGTGPGGTLWSTAIEDAPFSSNMTNLNGGVGTSVVGAGSNLSFQNYSANPQTQQLYSNNMNQVNQQGRRAITASHNFPHNMARQQQSQHTLYKGYSGSWANPGQNWASNSSVWNRGRSVPNMTPLQQQQMGVAAAGRKPSPTFNQQQQIISPVKFRRSTSYPGKGPFPQPPTFEITNMDEARDLLPYQVMCGTCN